MASQRRLKAEIAVIDIDIDIGKTTFHLIGQDKLEAGAAAAQVVKFSAAMSSDCVAEYSDAHRNMFSYA